MRGPPQNSAGQTARKPQAPQKGFIRIAEDRCKGCDLCIPACPVDIIAKADVQRTNALGWRPVRVTDMSRCVACRLCAVVCPDLAIEVFRFKKAKAASA